MRWSPAASASFATRACAPMRAITPCLLALFTLTAAAQAERALARALTIEQLKIAFLDCDRRASITLLDIGDAERCSVIYEELKARAFGGDFDRLLAWWRTQKLASEAGLLP
jgi:hypothetical protein